MGGGEGRRSRKRRQSVKSFSLLQRLPAPKWVQPPNGRVFFAKYQRVGRHVLTLTRVGIART